MRIFLGKKSCRKFDGERLPRGDEGKRTFDKIVVREIFIIFLTSAPRDNYEFEVRAWKEEKKLITSQP